MQHINNIPNLALQSQKFNIKNDYNDCTIVIDNKHHSHTLLKMPLWCNLCMCVDHGPKTCELRFENIRKCVLNVLKGDIAMSYYDILTHFKSIDSKQFELKNKNKNNKSILNTICQQQIARVQLILNELVDEGVLHIGMDKFYFPNSTTVVLRNGEQSSDPLTCHQRQLEKGLERGILNHHFDCVFFWKRVNNDEPQLIVDEKKVIQSENKKEIKKNKNEDVNEDVNADVDADVDVNDDVIVDAIGDANGNAFGDAIVDENILDEISDEKDEDNDDIMRVATKFILALHKIQSIKFSPKKFIVNNIIEMCIRGLKQQGFMVKKSSIDNSTQDFTAFAKSFESFKTNLRSYSNVVMNKTTYQLHDDIALKIMNDMTSMYYCCICTDPESNRDEIKHMFIYVFDCIIQVISA